MIPILFDTTATTFTTNGIGRLADATKCICTEERNGEYEIELEYPVTGNLFDEIQHSRIIVVKPSQNETAQAFRIYKITKPMFDGVITINAQHISYQLSNVPVAPFSTSSLANTLTALKSNSMENNPFTFTTDKTSTTAFGFTVPTTCRSLLGGHDGSILDIYGGEWHFDNYTCELMDSRGSDNGVVIRYGKNLIDLEQEENISNTFTGIVPYWSASDSDTCVYAPAVEASTASSYPFKRTEIIDFSSEFEAPPTTAQLTTLAQNYITKNNIGYPKISLNVDFINLADTEEYKNIAALETVSLCDYVTVKFDKLGIEEKAQIVKTEWDVLNERYLSIDVGSLQSDLSSTVADQGRAIETNLAKAREFTKDATGWLTNGAGYVIANKNSDGSWKELLFLDQPTTAAATKVLRINENGIGFASGTAGTFNSWTYYQAWTLDGSLSLGGVNNSYGSLKILNSSGAQIGVWDKDGISIKNASGVEIFNVNNNQIKYYSPSYATTTYISGNTQGVRVVDANNEATMSCGEVAVEDLSTHDYASITGGNVSVSNSSGTDTAQMSPGSISITDGTDTAELQADGVYINGTKLGTSGYTGTINDVVTELEYDGENFSYTSYNMTFENGVLVRIE